MPPVDVCPLGAEVTVLELADRLYCPERTARWRVARWEAEGLLRTRKAKVQGQRRWCKLLCAEDLERLLPGLTFTTELRRAA